MVSANVFHEPAQLKQSGCNGFVSKPVSQTELMRQLETHLSLAWIYEADLEAHLPGITAPPARTLSDESVAELTWLARIGDVTSLRRGIDRIEAEDAAARPECAHMRGMLDHVDLEGFSRWLRQD